LYYARDKGRARGMLYGILFTVIGCLIGAVLGKDAHKRGVRYADDVIKQHSEYSKAHQELISKTHEK
jgi:hypothetical protein